MGALTRATTPAWASGEAAAGVELLALGLDAAPDLEPLLDASELARAARFRFDTDRRRYVVGVGASRAALAERIGCDPRAIRFEVGVHGKPSLGGPPGLEFNVAHSGAWVLLALSERGPVGVDVEQLREELDVHELAGEVFTEPERLELAALREPRPSRAAFFRTWARKEAALKAWGTGLSLAARLVEVGLDAAARRTVLGPHLGLAALEVHDLVLDDRHAAAVALLPPGAARAAPLAPG